MSVLKSYFLLLFIVSFFCGFSQEANYSAEDISVNPFIDGTLLKPNSKDKPKLAILIAGSGPTDRNGNQNFLKNNSLKKLAESLSSQGIATFRYDKRVVKQIKTGNIDKNTMFDDFVKDAISVIEYFNLMMSTQFPLKTHHGDSYCSIVIYIKRRKQQNTHLK